MVYPDELLIQPLPRPPVATVHVPGSKSITNRALVLAAMAGRARPVAIRGALHSEDTEVMVECLRKLGFVVQTEWATATISIHNPSDTIIPVSQADLFTANSGTTMRFLAAFVAAGRGTYRLDGIDRMRERPIADLLLALRPLGVAARSERDNGCPPVVIETEGMRGGEVSVKGDVSSQFLSGLLMATPLAQRDVTISLSGPLVSEPYVAMTVAMLRQFGVAVVVNEPGTYQIAASQRPQRVDTYDVEPDASAASYFFGAAAITGGIVTVKGLDRGSLQGDVAFVDLLEAMGCRVVYRDNAITVQGGVLRGIDADMNAISDTVMTLAAVACFAEGPTTIRNVAHVRHKETDRLTAIATELRRLGVRVDEAPGGLTIHPGPLHGAAVSTYNDHRMAMSLALVGLRIPGVVIRNPACVAKTYPEFFHDLDKLRS